MTKINVVWVCVIINNEVKVRYYIFHNNKLKQTYWLNRPTNIILIENVNHDYITPKILLNSFKPKLDQCIHIVLAKDVDVITTNNGLRMIDPEQLDETVCWSSGSPIQY